MFYHGTNVYHCLDLAEGAIPTEETCKVLEDTCDALAIVADGNGWVATETPGYMIELGTFDWAAFQGRLLREFRINGAWECLYPPEIEVDTPDPPPPPVDDSSDSAYSCAVTYAEPRRTPSPCLG